LSSNSLIFLTALDVTTVSRVVSHFQRRKYHIFNFVYQHN